MKLIRSCVLVVLLAAFALASPVSAATTAASTITQIKILASCDPHYRLFHGAIWLEYDKATANYRWGGEHCGNKGLNDTQVGILFAAFRSKYNITIDYVVHKHKKRSYRALWIARMSAACRANGISYSRFIEGLAKANIRLNRKMLSEIAIQDPAGFTSIVEQAKAGLS